MLPYKEDELFVVSFSARITKAGQKMAILTVADSSRNLHPVTVFPTNFATAFMKVEEGKAYKLKLGKTKDGTITMEDVYV